MFDFEPNQLTAVLLGIMQDGGLPHAGCSCLRCTAALADPAQAIPAACLGLVDTRQRQTAVYLFDATPDITRQLALLGHALGPHPTRPNRLRQPDALFLTHAHMGHIGGLLQLGPEAMAVENLAVYAPPALCQLLQKTSLWQPLVNRLELRPQFPKETIWLGEDVRVTAVSVPHRDEWRAGTYAYRLQGPNRSLLYLPDIDAWEQWPEAETVIGGVDIALLDASFYSREELGGRSPVAHPLVTDTLDRFAELETELVLVHLNHTNPVLDAGSAAQTAVLQHGVAVGSVGQRFPL